MHHGVVAAEARSNQRVRGSMRSLDCSQEGDLSSAPLIAQEKALMA
jgi:hypothetical protein